MQSLTEALGLCLPGSAVVPAVAAKKYWYAEESGRQILHLVRNGTTARKILTRETFENAARVLMAMGGSTNAILHLIAVARKAGIGLDLERFDRLSTETPFLCNVKPSGRYTVKDFADAGGVPAVQKAVAALLDLSVTTVTGKTLGENLAQIPEKKTDVIADAAHPLSRDGGITVLKGNLAPDGAIIKKSGVSPDLYRHRGPARVFDRYKEFEAMMHGDTIDLTADQVVVIRNEGPRGGPGMQEILIPPALYRRGLQDLLIITDGRTSGTSAGRLVVHAAPEAAAGGPLGLIRTGDIIALDIAAKSLTVELDEKVLSERKTEWRRQPAQPESEWLQLYRNLACSAAEGAVIAF